MLTSKVGTRLLWRLMAVTLCIPALIAQAKPAQWTIQDLGALAPGAFTVANGVNDHGEIVGTASLGGPTFALHAFLWENGTLRDLGLPPGSTATSSQLQAINDHGVAVGRVGNQIFLWQDGQWMSTPITQAAANDINKRNSVAGFQGTTAGESAFLYRNGVLFTLPTLGGNRAEANAVNDSDVVVGWSLTMAGQQHAFRYDNGSMTDLGTLGGSVSIANDINSHGVIVGQSSDAASMFHAFVFDDSGMRPISCNVQGTSEATAVNDHGAIVGDFTMDVRSGPFHGFLCDNGELTLLDDIPAVSASGFSQLQPSDINERGWIVGTMRTANSSTLHSFVLIPG
jgi:probable HAF family extracellular repeat protein